MSGRLLRIWVLIGSGLVCGGCSGGENLSTTPEAGAAPATTDPATVDARWSGKGVGEICDILRDAGPTVAVFNAQALECAGRICVKPLDEPGVGMCTASCNEDSDCTPVANTPCQGGFACVIEFSVGPLACQKLCTCRDSLPDGADLSVPVACR